MLLEILRFEIRYQLRQPVFWIAGLFFFLLTFLAITTDAVVIGGSIGNVDRNAPFVITQMLLVMSIMGVFVTTAFVSSTVLRDAEHGTQEQFFSTLMTKPAYLLGRFGGALIVACLFFVPVALAILVGSWMPWLDPERVGPFRLAPYLTSLAILVWPNTLMSASLFFSLATWTRSMMGTYIGVVATFFGYFLAGNLLSDMENERLAAFLDPFAGGAVAVATKYWTVAERNTSSLELDGLLLGNRLVWVGLGLAFLALTYWRFSLTLVESRKARRRRRRERSAEATDAVEAVEGRPVTPADARPVPVALDFSRRTALRQFLAQTRMEVKGVLTSLAFPVILGFGVLNIIGNSTVIDQIFGTPVYPVTHLMMRILSGSSLFIYIILTFYSAELVWRERGARLDEVHDALPVPNWVLWSSKLVALCVVLLSLVVVSILTGIGVQLWRGYTNLEIGLYLQGVMLLAGLSLVLAAVLALFLQAVANNKYLGMLLMILYFISFPALRALDFNHYLYQYGQTPNAPYSDMNGFGHYVAPLFWFNLYWCFGAVLLLVLTHLLWVRGKEGSFRTRLRLARQRVSSGVMTAAGIGLLGFLGTGGFIFYNTNILNEYVPGDLQDERQVRFEKSYKQYEDLPQPRITAVYADVDIYPARRAVDIRGRYRLRNGTGAPVESLHLGLNPLIEIRRLELRAVEGGGELATEPELEDTELGYRIWKLASALPAGGEAELHFELAVENPGFVNHNANDGVVRNGTFFNNFEAFPRIGYRRDFELSDPNDRRKHGLPPIQRMPKLEDEAARRSHYITSESDWIDFETVVSTSEDQIALAPGYLQSEWSDNGRRYFHYKMDAPILGFFSYLSADWVVARDRWNDVRIEIYHHRGHPYNVERMIDGVKKSLDYFTREFGPYQHRQVRILEFPRYATFAQSFPNTIPFSEAIGFIAKLDEDDEEAIDYVFYVTAHEVAHQWWAHQAIGANVQGATVITETMSQYSALMVMEHEYGPDKMRRFLKYELDNYLRSRGGELIEELPLLRVENQPYIHYRKGSVVMYALKDYFGEAALNQQIRAFLDEVKYQEPPYTTTREFLGFLAQAAPPEQRELLANLVEEITLYDHRASEATYRKRDDGRYEVRLAVESKKYRSDGEGTETEVPLNDWVDVGVFGEKSEETGDEGKVLSLQKHRLTPATGEIVLVVDETPRRAGLDPYHKLIDRNPDDNLTKVTEATGR